MGEWERSCDSVHLEALGLRGTQVGFGGTEYRLQTIGYGDCWEEKDYLALLRGHLVVDKGELDNYEDVATISVLLWLRFESAAVATVMPGRRAYWRLKDGWRVVTGLWRRA